MEEKVREIFGITAPDLRQVPVLTLAYVGDSAYELILRTYFAETTTLSAFATEVAINLSDLEWKC